MRHADCVAGRPAVCPNVLTCVVPQTRVVGVKYGQWGREKYGVSPAKVDTMEVSTLRPVLGLHANTAHALTIIHSAALRQLRQMLTYTLMRGHALWRVPLSWQRPSQWLLHECSCTAATM